MKPDGVLTSSEMDDVEVEPHELFTQLGMLVVESRLPELTAKGRRRGPHCPSFLGEVTAHKCDAGYRQCQKAQTMLRQMTSLWRNRVPMCIEVVLLPDCSHGVERTNAGNVSLPTDKSGSQLLEQWNIQVLPRRASDNPVSMKMLFQAVQSHLYFSQLSAWLNLTQGKMPTNICYRILPPGDFCTSTFPQPPVNHTFPVAAVSKSLSIKVTAGCLPRMQEIPHIRCRESHEENIPSTARAGEQLAESCCRTSKRSPSMSPPPAHTRDQGRNSPRFQKPHIIRELPLDGDRYRRVPRDCHSVQTQSKTAHRQNEVTRPESAASCVRDHSTPGPARHTGAIPKCFSHKSPPATCYESDYASSAPELESMAKDKRHSAGPALPSTDESPQLTSPKVIITHKSPTQVYYSKENRVNRILQNVVNKDSSTDSDSSSPDIDRYLNRTLRTGHLEPLSPAEMESYLDNLVKLAPSRGKKEYECVPIVEQKNLTYDIQRCDFDMEHKKSSYCKTGEGLRTNSQDPSSLAASFQSLLLRKEQPSVRESISKAHTKQSSQNLVKSNARAHNDFNDVASNGSYIKPNDQNDCVKFTIYDEDVVPESSMADRMEHEPQANGATNVANGTNATNGASPCLAQSLQADRLVTYDSDTTVCVPEDCRDAFSSSGSSQTSMSPPSRSLPFHKSISCPGSGSQTGFTLPATPALSRTNSNNANNLLKNVMRKEMAVVDQGKENIPTKKSVPIPSDFDRIHFQKSLNKCANMIFHAATGLPMQSSPAPVKKRSSDNFDYDVNLTNPRAIKNSISCVSLDKQKGEDDDDGKSGQPQRTYSTSAPAITNCLLGNFEESMLNGRLEPSGVIEGFSADIGASGTFCPKHVALPMTTFFFSLSDDNAPSPYLGHINLEAQTKRGYHVPKKGTVQVTIFNPHKTVVKMFVVVYDLEDMPANCQTFLRQRTLYMPVLGSASDTPEAPTFLRYLIHLRFSSSKSSKIYLHTDIRVIFARDKFEFDSQVANYELRSYTEGPVNPKFSPKR